jgi:hypothetical protein
MTFSPEQSRKVAAQREESERHARYSSADGTRDTGERNATVSPAIAAAGRRVEAARVKEEKTIGGAD